MLSYQQENFFLTPVTIVPNGRLHLGHIAGPLLKMDCLCRYLRSRGHRVTFISSTDPHESHVEVRAFLEGFTPSDVANTYYEGIRSDLAALSIEFDLFLNPLNPELNEIYTEINLKLIQQLNRSGKTQLKREKIPYLPSNHRPLLGGWIQGNCPECQSKVVSLFCEKCGTHFMPEQIIHLRYRFSEESPEWKEVNTQWLHVNQNQLFEKLSQMGIPEHFLQILKEYVAKNTATIRLTHPANWGIKFSPFGTDEQVLYTYSSVLLGCHLFSGEISRLKGYTKTNPFSIDSKTTTVISFGIDNTIPFLLGATGIGLSQTVFKGPDHYLCNHFYHLEGEKFSTNRRHVIWAGDIVAKAGAHPDLVRLYMIETTPEKGVTNFDIAEFVRFYREFHAVFAELKPLKLDGEFQAPSNFLLHQLIEALKEQDNSMSLNSFSFSTSVLPMKNWLKERNTFFSREPADMYWWYVGFALLCYPFMPSFGKLIWNRCGKSGFPSWNDAFLRPDLAHEEIEDSPFRKVPSQEDLYSCLPSRS